MEVSHGGGVFTTRILERDGDDARMLLEMNRLLLTSFGLKDGVSHTEFIRAHHDERDSTFSKPRPASEARIFQIWSRQLYECEPLGRVGQDRNGLSRTSVLAAPQPRNDYAALLVSLSRQESPDTSAYNDEEIVWRMDRKHHVGLIVRSSSSDRIRQLLDSYAHLAFSRTSGASTAAARQTRRLTLHTSQGTRIGSINI